MLIFKRFSDFHKQVDRMRKNGETIGFVPTMGALHAGHLSLIAESKRQTDKTVSTIFVNPTQFNNQADFEKYPSTIDNDVYLLQKSGCDILLLPSVEEVYPATFNKEQQFDLGEIENVLEGKYRPGHFQGVCQVMKRLLEEVKPDDLFMGQKDLQQCMVVKKLLGMLEIPISLHIATTIRSEDGLALSSRNLRLTEEEKIKALTIYEVLKQMKKNLQKGNVAEIRQAGTDMLEQAGFTVDYVAVASGKDLQLISEWDGETEVFGLVAATLNQVRLIDNLSLHQNHISS